LHNLWRELALRVFRYNTLLEGRRDVLAGTIIVSVLFLALDAFLLTLKIMRRNQGAPSDSP